MPDLVIRPSGKEAPKDWSLQLRFHESLGPTEYQTIARVSRDTAVAILNAGGAISMFSDPRDG